MRFDGRQDADMRAFTFERNFTKYANGSVLVSYGDTKVLCTAMIDDSVPRFMRDSGNGWLTAEYALLPSSSADRINREVNRGKPSGRTSEIQRLIGRALRVVVDLTQIGERTIYIDTDVIQADGGTRTAAVTGGMIAVADAVNGLMATGELRENPIKEFLAAISVGVVDGRVLCDLCYEEDSKAEVDMNVVMTETGRFVELQGTAESDPFTEEQLADMLVISKAAVSSIIASIKAEVSTGTSTVHV